MDDLKAIAGRLLNQEILAAEPAAGGGNNRVYRVTTEGGAYTLKFYPPQEEDKRDRLGQEFAALEFMAANGIDCVPKPIAADKDLCCGVYEWIAGAPVGGPDEGDIDAMTALAARLAELSGAPGTEDLAPASAHCFSGVAVTQQLNQRLRRLGEAGRDNDALNRFLKDNFRPRLEALAGRAKGFEADLAPGHRTLSPSDFGFHNALKRNTGGIVFLDFEYFGWDDPVKMISDVLWHPGSNLAPALGEKFRKDAGKIFEARDDGFAARFDALYPLFGMIWCLILLNEFLPERWRRRVAAGNTTDAAGAQARQLQAAEDLLQKIEHA
jgi:hypothetical protein